MSLQFSFMLWLCAWKMVDTNIKYTVCDLYWKNFSMHVSQPQIRMAIWYNIYFIFIFHKGKYMIQWLIAFLKKYLFNFALLF